MFLDTVILALRKASDNQKEKIIAYTSFIEINTLLTLVSTYVYYSHDVVLVTRPKHFRKVWKT